MTTAHVLMKKRKIEMKIFVLFHRALFAKTVALTMQHINGIIRSMLKGLRQCFRTASKCLLKPMQYSRQV